MKLNIAKTGFFISLKGHKSNSAFANFYYSFYKDDFFIPIPVRPLKIEPNKFNASEGVTPNLNLYRLKDCHRFEVSNGVNIGNNGFKDLNSWESIEKGHRMPEDRLYEPIKSQEVTVGPKQASISG